jgi:hypothetical protein
MAMSSTTTRRRTGTTKTGTTDTPRCPRCNRRGSTNEGTICYCHHCKMQFDSQDDGTVGYGDPSRRIEREERQAARKRIAVRNSTKRLFRY